MPAPHLIDEARRYLDGQTIAYRRPTAVHLKVGRVNFYATGTVHVDGEPGQVGRGRGLDALIAVLREQGYRLRSPSLVPADPVLPRPTTLRLVSDTTAQDAGVVPVTKNEARRKSRRVPSLDDVPW